MAQTLGKAGPKEILRHCESLGLDPRVVAGCLAVSLKTVQRWQDGSARPNESSMRSLEKLEAIYQLAARLLERRALKEWFHSPNESLGDEPPADLLRRGELDRVRNVLGMLEWGIYS